MHIKSTLITVASAALLCTATAYAYVGEQYAKDAKITMEQARSHALQLAPGNIKDAELEKEGSGSRLRYSFDIQTKSGIREVGIDAMTGKVVENKVESSQAEAREMRAEHAHEHGEGSEPEDERGEGAN